MKDFHGAGNLTTIVDPQGHTTAFGYNKLGEETSLADPDRGSESYSYDANGNVSETVDARGASGTIYAAYDGLNRQLWRNSTNSSSGAYVTYSYDSTAGGNAGVGRLTGESFNGGTGGTALGHGQYSYTYDARGQETTWGVTLGGSTYSFAYGYTDFGAPSSLTYSDGEVASDGYSPSGALASLSTTPSGGSATTLLSTLLFSTAAGTSGLLSSVNVANSTYKYAPTYDGDLRLASQTWTTVGSGVTLFSNARTYDNVGNVASVSTTLPAGTDNQAFCYDEQDRITWASSNSATPPCGGTLTSGTLTSAGYGPVTFGYDTLDRMTSSPSGANVYGDSAHLHAETSIGSSYSAIYDAAGNMTCRAPSSNTPCSGGANGQILTYDNEGRLITWQNMPSNPTATEQMAYDGEGNRVALAVNGGTPTYYLGSLEEVSGSTLVKYFNSSAVSSALPTAERVGAGGALAYLADDGLGSVDAALDGSGNVTYQALYTAFGTQRFVSGTSPSDKGFTGQKNDSASGLDYFNARYYDFAGRQFISADKVRDGPNPYAYVHNNPCTNTDPSGLTCESSKLQRVYAWVQIALAWWRNNFLPTPLYPAAPPESSIVGQTGPVQGPGRLLPENGFPQPPVGNSRGTQWVQATGPDPADPGGAPAPGSATGSTDILQSGGSGCNNGGSPPNNPTYGPSPRNTTLPSQTANVRQVTQNGKSMPRSNSVQVDPQLERSILRAEQRMSQLDWWVANYKPAPQVANPGWCLGPMCPLAWLEAFGGAVAGAVASAAMQSSEPEDVPERSIAMPGALPLGPGGILGATMR